MACLVLGGVGLVQSVARAADLPVTSTPAVTVTTGASSTALTVSPVDVTFTTTTPALAIQDQNFVAVIGRPMTLTLHAANGTAPYQWALIANGLPEGLFFNQETGQVVGSPGRTGHFTFTVQLRDARQVVVTKQLALDVYLADAVPAMLPSTSSSTVADLDISPVIIDLSNVTPDQVNTLVDAFPDTAPLIYVGPNAPTSILKINIAQMRIKPNGLYRVEGGTPSMVNESHRYSGVYYVDENGRRHAFPTEQVFNSWYNAEPTIEAVPDWKIANIPLRENVTYRPGTVIRLENSQEYYRVLPKRTLKKFQDEATYQRLASAVKPIPAGSPLAAQVVPVLPLAQVADYIMDVNPITSMSDVPTLSNLPLTPGQAMVQM